MQRYSEYSPTPFDSKGAFLRDQQDWLVCPVGITRDTEGHDYALSNFRVLEGMLDDADPDGEDHELCSFNHWGPGWFEIIIVKPESKCADIAAEVEKALENYPILSDDDYSEREFNAAIEAWRWIDTDERVKALQYSRDYGGRDVSIFSARSDDMPMVEWETHSDGIYFTT